MGGAKKILVYVAHGFWDMTKTRNRTINEMMHRMGKFHGKLFY